MRHVMNVVVSLVGLFVSVASYASLMPIEVSARPPVGECTAEKNEFGFPSLCHCEEGDSYFEAAGLCIAVDQDPPQANVAGKLLAHEMEAGGEGTGVVLVGDEASYSLIINQASQAMLEQLDGGFVEARGKLIYLPSPTLGNRPTLVVEDLVSQE